MARIPDYTAIGEQPSLNSGRVLPTNNSGEILARSVGNAGNQLAQLGGQIQQQRNNFAYANARAQLAVTDMQTRREVMETGDYGEWEKLYADKMTARTGELASSLSSIDRQRFELDAMADTERGKGAIYTQAFAREKDEGLASLNQNITALQDSLVGASPQDATVFIGRAHEAIEAAYNDKYLSTSQKVDLRQKATVSFIETMTEGMEPEERLAMLLTRTDLGDDPESVAGLTKKYGEGASTVIRHSRDMVQTGRSVKNPDGSVSTFMGAVVTDDRINDGKPTLIPTVWDGEVLDQSDPAQYERIIKNVEDSMDAGDEWPAAETIKEALAMEKEIHAALEPHAELARTERTAVDALPLSTWKKMVSVAERQSEGDRVLRQSDALANRVWSADKSWAEIDAEIRAGTKDIKVREAALRLAEGRYNDQNKVRTDLFESLADGIRQGEVTTQDLMEPDILGTLNNNQFGTLEAMLRGVGGGSMDWELYNDIQGLSDDEFMQAMETAGGLNNLTAGLDVTRANKIAERAMQIQSGAEPDIPVEAREILKSAFPRASAKGKVRGIAADMYGLYAEEQAKFRKAEGRLPNALEAQDIVDDMAVKVEYGTTGIFGRQTTATKPFAQVPMGESIERIRYSNISVNRRRDIERAWDARGIVPTEDQVVETYRAMLEQRLGKDANRTVGALQFYFQAMQEKAEAGLLGRDEEQEYLMLQGMFGE